MQQIRFVWHTNICVDLSHWPKQRRVSNSSVVISSVDQLQHVQSNISLWLSFLHILPAEFLSVLKYTMETRGSKKSDRLYHYQIIDGWNTPNHVLMNKCIIFPLGTYFYYLFTAMNIVWHDFKQVKSYEWNRHKRMKKVEVNFLLFHILNVCIILSHALQNARWNRWCSCIWKHSMSKDTKCKEKKS